MKLFKLLFVIPGLLIISCSNNDDSPTTINWAVGAATDAGAVTQVFDSNDATTLDMEFTTGSLCGNSGIDVVVEAEGSEIYSINITEFPFSTATPIPENTEISVTTTIVTIPDSQIVCVWLGNVDCKLTY